MRIGPGSDPATEMGPTVDENQFKTVLSYINIGREDGATLVCGGERATGDGLDKGYFVHPTVFDRVTPDMELVREETFGPVSPILRFKDADEAIRMVNGTAYGLSSGVCTNRMDYVTKFVSELNVGTVNIWEVPGYRLESTPFGGIKDSGLGYKEGVVEAMKSFTNVKTYSLPWPA